MNHLLESLLYSDFVAGGALYQATVKASWIAMPLVLTFATLYALIFNTSLQGVIGRFILSSILISSMSSIFSGTKDLSFSLGESVLKAGTSSKSNSLLEEWKRTMRGSSIPRLEKKLDSETWWITRKLNEVKDGISLPSADELILKGIWVIVWGVLAAIKIIYSSVYHLTLISSPLVLLMSIIPTFNRGLDSLIKTIFWLILVPFIISIIMLAGTEFLSLSAQKGPEQIYSMSTYLSMALFAIFLAFSVVAATLLVNSEGLHELGSKAGNLVAIGAGVGALKHIYNNGGKELLKSGTMRGISGMAGIGNGMANGAGEGYRSLQSGIGRVAAGEPIRSSNINETNSPKTPSPQMVKAATTLDRLINNGASKRADGMRSDFIEANKDAIISENIPRHAFLNDKAYSGFIEEMNSNPSKYLQHAGSTDVLKIPNYGELAERHNDKSYLNRRSSEITREIKKNPSLDINSLANKYTKKELDMASQKLKQVKPDKYTINNRSNALRNHLIKRGED